MIGRCLVASIFDNGALVFVSVGGTLTALDRETGAPMWRHQLAFAPIELHASREALVVAGPDTIVEIPLAPWH